MKPPRIKTSRLKYFPVKEHWRKLGPLFRSPEAKAIWLPNMRDFMVNRAHDYKIKYTPDPKREQCPAAFDSCDWRYNHQGRHPAFWDFVCYRACHWVVDLCLYVATTAYPRIPWRIVWSHKHSTVWNGCTKNPVLFDINFLALGLSPKEAWQLAARGNVLKRKWLHPWNVPDKLK